MKETSDIGLTKLKPAKALPDDVYDAILHMLLWGSLEPEAQLSIDKLAASLGVSPTPVREALARLEHTGLVKREARRGYRVAPPMSTSQIVELVDARRVVEAGAMRLAMANQAALLPALEESLARHQASAARLADATDEAEPEALQKYFEDDWSFHQAVLTPCGNRYLELAVNSMSFRVHRMRQTIGAGHSDAPAAVGEHKTILEAVRSGDAETAARAMEAHLDALMARVKHPDE